MPFCLVKLSVSPGCSVPAEIARLAPVRYASSDVTDTLESTATAVPPGSKVFVTPDGWTTGAGYATPTLSVAAPLPSEPSMATIEMARAVVLVLVVENATDSRAAWYWATVAVPFRVSTPVLVT